MNFIAVRRSFSGNVRKFRINMDTVAYYKPFGDNEEKTMFIFAYTLKDSASTIVVEHTPEEIDKMVGLLSDFDFKIS